MIPLQYVEKKVVLFAKSKFCPLDDWAVKETENYEGAAAAAADDDDDDDNWCLWALNTINTCTCYTFSQGVICQISADSLNVDSLVIL
jgi:hypothetical protein